MRAMIVLSSTFTPLRPLVTSAASNAITITGTISEAAATMTSCRGVLIGET
jgi:hypothetical protein